MASFSSSRARSASRLRNWVRSAHLPVLRAHSSALPPWVRSSRFVRAPVALLAEFLTALACLITPQNQQKHNRWLRSVRFCGPQWLRSLSSRPRSFDLSRRKISTNIIGGFVRRIFACHVGFVSALAAIRRRPTRIGQRTTDNARKDYPTIIHYARCPRLCTFIPRLSENCDRDNWCDRENGTGPEKCCVQQDRLAVRRPADSRGSR